MSPLPLTLLVLALCALALPSESAAQVEAEPVLAGRVRVADTTLAAGTVVLHYDNGERSESIDSMRTGRDGSFSFALPRVPNPSTGEMFFASVNHAGVMYFGPAVTQPVQLDSLYVIQTYDTIMAPAEGLSVVLAARNVFLEESEGAWHVTDVFQLRNDRDRTIVARPGGRVWSYPLPSVARQVVTSEGEMSPDVATYEGGSLVVRAALPPGERLFVVRYVLDSPEVTIPTPGETEALDVLVREPAPPLDVSDMQQGQSIALDTGGTFRRYSADSVSVPSIRVTLGEEVAPPPVQWIAVVLALVLAGGGLLALRAKKRPAAAEVHGREAILLEIARLDEEFQSSGSHSKSAEREYREHRAELLSRLRARQ